MAKVTPQSILDSLTDAVNEAMEQYSVGSEGYDALNSVHGMIEIQQTIIDMAVKAKEDRDDKAFDILHNCYDTMLERGYVGIPTTFHKFLSDLSVGLIGANDVFEYISEDEKLMILDGLFTPDFNEQMVAQRHDFHYLTSKTGHDGIDPEGKVYEAKNKEYNPKAGKKIGPDIQFSGVSMNVHRKLSEGRPLIIANITHGHKLLFECVVEFSDDILTRYKKTAEQNTKGITYVFSQYKKSIKDITHICEDIEDYENLDKKFMRELKELTTSNRYTAKTTIVKGY